MIELFASEYLVLCLFINVIVFIIKNGISDIITKGEGKNPEEGFRKTIVDKLILSMVFIISFLLTWFIGTLGYITVLNDSLFITSAWIAILSVATYEIGVKEILGYIKKALIKIFQKEN